MNQRQSVLFWSFGVGTWFHVHIGISWLMVLLAAWCGLKFGMAFGGALFGVMFVSVLLHEIGHVVAARATGGTADEILIWPFGGLAFVGVSSAPRAQILTSLAGPLMNLMLCSLTLPAVLYSDYARAAFNPLKLPFPADSFGSADLLTDLQVMAFSWNWMMLLINLIPCWPLDGGHVLRSWLAGRVGGQAATEIGIRVAFVAGTIMALTAILIFEHVFLLGLAFLFILLAMQESQQLQAGETGEDSFMGYDFSQGYTSLERSQRKEQPPQQRPGLLQRWLEKRRADKRRREEEQQQEAESQLDALLAKVHEQGIGALTDAEKRMLKRASDRYRSKGDERS